MAQTHIQIQISALLCAKQVTRAYRLEHDRITINFPTLKEPVSGQKVSPTLRIEIPVTRLVTE